MCVRVCAMSGFTSLFLLKTMVSVIGINIAGEKKWIMFFSILSLRPHHYFYFCCYYPHSPSSTGGQLC